MYIKIGPTTPNDDFSWIISKNPGGAPYERQVGGAATGRRVVGKFLTDGAFMGLEWAQAGTIDKTL